MRRIALKNCMDINKINKLSVIIPCYNEQNTIELIVNEILMVHLGSNTKLEIVIIDDCSQDNSRVIIEGLVKKHPQISSILQSKNHGKGAALKQGILKSTGDVVIVQDADREYDPRDYVKMLNILERIEQI